ncbi:MAG: PQQ-binding-like beta-propeller repeat protein [Candidatus Bilamarchaeaceae archaeon]
MRQATALLFLLLLSTSYAGELWRIDAGSAVRGQPAELGARIVVATEGGKVYSIEPPALKWSYDAKSPIVFGPAILGGDKIIVATESKLIALNQYGALQWEISLPGITSFAVSDKIYVADQNGIQAVSANGTLAWNFSPGSEEQSPPAGSAYAGAKPLVDQFCTAPLATNSQVFFGNRNYLYSISTSGAFQWKSQIGHLWNTPPYYDAGTFTVYAGTSEGVLYALESPNGKTRFSQNVYGQISTTPLLFEGNVLVGTSKNTLHAVSDLGIQWSAPLDGKVNKAMEAAVSPGGKSILYLTTTKSLYAINPRSGEVLFKRPFLDWPSPPNYVNGQIVVGTADGKIYGLDSVKECSITEPAQDSKVGDYALTLRGISYSAHGEPATEIRINSGTWVPVEGTEWEYGIDLSQYPYGVMEIECRVSDASGQETEPYSKTALIHAQDAKPLLMSAKYPDTVKANTEFSILFYDAGGLPLSGVLAKAAGKVFTSNENGNMTLSLPEGTYEIALEKPGYRAEKIVISSKGEPILGHLLGLLFLAGLAAYAYFFFLKKEGGKKIIQEK